MKLSDEQKKKLDEVFPFEYKGGGYYRRKGVKKGISAEILHGKQVAEYLFLSLTNPEMLIQYMETVE